MESSIITFIFVSLIASETGALEYFQTQTAKLRFKISGRNLIDSDGFSTTDGYVKVFYSNDGGRIIKPLGRTETITDKQNPDWGKHFEFHFDRKLNQYWLFQVYDEDHFGFDDPVGSVWVNVADYVDKRQLVQANLAFDQGGYLTIKDSSGAIEKKSKRKKVTPGMLPLRHGTPISKKIRFQVSLRGITRNINHRETLVVTLSEGVNGAEKSVGRSTVLTSGLNPSWDRVFTVNWNKKKDHRLHFKVYDGRGEKKELKESDKVGDGWIQVNDYIAKGEVCTVILSPKGALTMLKI